jgi:hypothetical protein
MTKLVLIIVYRIVKHWIFIVFHPLDPSNLLIEIGYPLSLVVQTDTLDLLISIGYLLSSVIEFDLSNLSIGFYKNNRTYLGFNFLTDI